MEIALIAPSSVPFVWGGAENLYASLQSYINEETSHSCEVIKIPTRESDLQSILQSYKLHLNADVSHFDMLISTKYPSWMAPNKRHVCYMLHKLRGLYDTYHFMGEPTELVDTSGSIAKRLASFEKTVSQGRASPSKVGDFIDGLLDEIATSPLDPQFRFPGPCSRKTIHMLDDWGLSRERIHKYGAISQNVAGRADYFRGRSSVSVLYPPPRMSGFRCAGDDYFFTMSRLDSPKRIDMIVSAVKAMRDPIPLLIAGTGPDEARLRELAGDDPNIHFVGRIDDDQAVEFYSNALAVPFIPYDEDYGYITIEAMLSGKPVITASDSGGPLEFVRHGETGLVCPPIVEALTQQLEYAVKNRANMREMGRQGRESVKSIGWGKFVDEMIEPLDRSQPMKRLQNINEQSIDHKDKIVVVLTFPAFPVRGGGQARVFNLYRSLAKTFDVELVCLCGAEERAESEMIAPGLRQTKVPMSASQAEFEIQMSRSVAWVPVTDIAAIDGWALTPAYSDAVRMASEHASAVVLSHPYLIRCIENLELKTPIWFEAHNVEAPLKQQMLPAGPASQALIELVKDVEQRCWQTAEVAFTCTAEDIDSLNRLYGHRSGPTCTVPNGVDPDTSPFVAPGQRSALRAHYGLPLGPCALFVGSWHEPNIDAARLIVAMARDLPTIDFLIVGSVCLAIEDEDRPRNIKLLGVLEDDVKELVGAVCDIALNPMQFGSGSNLKMFDYLSSGNPVLSTRFGARGIDLSLGEKCIVVSDIDEFSINIIKLLTDLSLRELLADNARKLITSEYTWSIIAEKFVYFLNKNINKFNQSNTCLEKSI